MPWIDLGEVSGEQETDGDIVSASTDQIIGMVIKAMMMTMMMTMTMMMMKSGGFSYGGFSYS